MSLWDTVRGSYWFVPSLMAIASAIAALCLLRLDGSVDREWVVKLPWIYSATSEGGRAVLSVIAGSMITVTGVVFSITIVALTLASSQFGPRLLRNFMRDRANQAVMGTFLATFLFSLIVLRAIEPGEQPFIPYLSMATAAGLGVISLFVLIFFIHHAASSIQASEVIRAVAVEIDQALPTLFPETVGKSADEPSAQDQEIGAQYSEAWAVDARDTGYIRVIDSEGLLGIASDHDLVLWLECTPGDFVSPGIEIARVAGAEPTDAVKNRVRSTFAVGSHRSGVQDLPFLTHQLTEVAVRALSPGVNDPQTAVSCIDRLGAVTRALAIRSFPSAYRRDDDGRIRVVAAPTRFDTFVTGMLSPIRHYGAGDVDVVLSLLRVVASAIPGAVEERGAFLSKYYLEIYRAGMEEIRTPSDRERLEEHARGFREA